MNTMVPIEMLVEHEETIGRLYETYAVRFPESRTLWSQLASEEKDHAKMIRDLIEERKLGHVYFDSVRFNPEAIETSVKYVVQETVRAKTGDIELTNAFAIALNIEKSIIDNKVFDTFKGYTKKTRELIEYLARSVITHYQLIERTWSEHRRYS